MDRWTDEIVAEYYNILKAEWHDFEDSDSIDERYTKTEVDELRYAWETYGLRDVFPTFESFLYSPQGEIVR